MSTTAAPARRADARGRTTGAPPSFWRSAANGAVAVVLLAVLALAIALAVVPRMMGGAALTVLTGSMEPTYSPGDMVVSLPHDRYAVGDIVTFQPVSDDPALITHRIVSVLELPSGTEYVTRGDANGADDVPIVAEQIMGEVAYSVPWIGFASQAAGDHRSLLLALAGAGLLGYGIYAVGAAVLARRRAASPTPATHLRGE